MTNKPEPITRAGEAQAHQLATALMGVERFTADGNFHPDYLAMLTRPGEALKPPFHFDRYVGGVLMAEGVTIERRGDLASAILAAARIAPKGANRQVPVLVLRPEPNTRPLPQPSELVAEVKRLTALADDHFRNARRLSEVVVARDAQIAKLQADGDKLAGALEAFQRKDFAAAIRKLGVDDGTD